MSLIAWILRPCGWRTMEDEDFIQRCREGDRQAQAELYRSTSEKIYRLMLRMTRNSDDAFDLTQQTYVQALQNFSRFEGRSPLSTWLHRIAVTQVLMEQRSASRRGRVLDLPTPSASGTREGALIDLERAMTRLPERARAVFVLHDVEGYRHAEVADLLGVTVGTSKAQLHRARKLLREELNR